MHRCPMILKPFACLIQLIILFAVSAVSAVFFFGTILIITFFRGELLMYKATYEAKESNMLMKKYKNEGVNVDGNVERIWSDWEYRSGTSDTPSTFILVERALISYEYGGDQYKMRIMPLLKYVKDLRENPESGIPTVRLPGLSWSPLSRILLFTFGLAISSLWTFLPVCFLLADEDKPDDDWGHYNNEDSTTSSENDNHWRILVAIALLVGVLPNALFFIWKGFRDRIQSVAATIFETKSHKEYILDDIQVWLWSDGTE
eukprot:316116_1